MRPVANLRRASPPQVALGLLGVWMSCLAGQAEAAEWGAGDADHWRLGGYLKTVVESSRTAAPEERAYDLSLSRLRLKLDGELSQSLRLRVEHDTELRAGSFLDTQVFGASSTLSDQQYAWGGDQSVLTEEEYALSQRFYRAYLRGSWGDIGMTLGRQRIALGTGRYWSGLDLLNPNNPQRIELDERIGVDALRLELKSGYTTRWVYLAAPDPLQVGTRQLVQFGTNVHEIDVTLSGGTLRNDQLYGVDFATQVGGAGLHGEWVYTLADIGADYQKYLLGADYGFISGLTLSAEIFRSTQSESDLAATVAAIPELPFLLPIGRSYAGLVASYEPDPIYSINLTWLRNGDDDSEFRAATVTYTFTESLVLAMGVQAVEGDDQSDYGRGHSLSYLYLQWYF